MNLLFDIASVCVFFSCAFFLATYHILARWWQSQAGVNIVAMTSAVMGYALLRCLTMIFGNGYSGQTLLRVLLGFLVFGVVVHRWYLLLRVQAGERRHVSEVHPPGDS